MPKDTCIACGGPIHWKWEEAFDKFGFEDGGGTVMTDTVVSYLKSAGYLVSSSQFSIHNEVIESIARNGVELIPAGTRIGYDDPRQYLPQEIIEFLDRELPDQSGDMP